MTGCSFLAHVHIVKQCDSLASVHILPSQKCFQKVYRLKQVIAEPSSEPPNLLRGIIFSKLELIALKENWNQTPEF